MSSTTVGVVGLGQMGLGMATSLAGKGFAVLGCDLSAERRALAEAAGIRVAPLSDVAANCAVVVLSLPMAAHVADVVERPDGLLASLPRGAVIVDTSTSEASVSRRLATVAGERGIGFLDAPVSGGVAGAASGALTMMIGGTAEALETARPALAAMATRIFHVGPSGAGNVAKLVNNLLVAAHLLTVSEAMRLAEAAGVPTAAALQVVNVSTGRSAVSEINFPRWIETGTFDSGFTMGLMRKDVRLALELAAESGCTLPVSELVGRTWKHSAATLADGQDFNRIATLTPAPEASDGNP
ncbi:MAG: NAD(P)-dependent oxidoreductase [Hyphomicrobiaceae bacterium]